MYTRLAKQVHKMRDDSSKGPGARTPQQRLVFAVCLIVAGALLFLGNLGLLPSVNLWNFWPLILLAVGLQKAYQASYRRGKLTGLMMVFFGLLLLLINLHILQIRTRDASWPISMVLIAFGMAMLIKVLDRDSAGHPACGWNRRTDDNQAGLRDLVILGSSKRKIDSAEFTGGEVTTILGSIEIDLRRARISSLTPAVLDATSIFGGIKIRVPDTWRILVRGAAILGSYEDKTVLPSGGEGAPTLIITGASVFSAIEIED
jgi:predicted membrane protein